MMIRAYFIFIFTLTTAILTACGAASQSPQNGMESQAGVEAEPAPLKVATTIGQITDMVHQIGGERVVVTGLMGPGVDPHLYQASEGDVETLFEADMIFYNGLFLEAQMEEIFEQMGDKAIAVSSNIDRERLMDWEAYENAYDPHIWFEVPLWMEAAKTVRDALAERDPDHAQLYRDNAAAYLADLEALHRYILTQVEKIPAEQRVLITAHDAFEYFARTYDFEVRGLQGISTASEAGTADLQALADFIVERQIGAIFVETSVPRRTVEAVQAAARDQGFAVEIGGELFSDAIGDPATPEGTYIGAVRHNVDTIVEALTKNNPS